MTAAPAEGKCTARSVDGLMRCARCGLEWIAGTEKPACAPVTWSRMRSSLLYCLEREQTSARLLAEMKRDGTSAADQAANPAQCLRRAADLDAILTLLDRVTGSPKLKAAIVGKAEDEKE
jgi:hypothetical protein